MSRKAYKILTDIDLSRNNLLNVCNIKGPDIDGLSKDLKIHADKGDLRIETTSDGKKGQITLGIGEKESISIEPKGTVSVEDDNVIVKGTTKLAVGSSDDNSITLTAKDDSIKVDADLIEVGSEKDPIKAINEHITAKNSAIEKYIHTVNGTYRVTRSPARSSDFEISASENDSHIKANTLTANNNVKIGSQNNGVNIYWDKNSKSLVFTKWE